MISGFYGKFVVRIDANGRLALPARLRPTRPREGKAKGYILTMGLDGCLIFYPEEEWKKILDKLDTLEFTRRDFRNFTRQLYSNAVIVKPDGQGRMIIPDHLVEYAGLKDEVLVLGSNRWIELWDPLKYKNYLADYRQSYEEVAENLFPPNRPKE